MVSSVSASAIYIMKVHFLDHLLKDVKSFGDISPQDAFAHEEFNVYIKKALQRSSRRRASCMQKTVMLMERQRRGEQQTTCTEKGVVREVGYIGCPLSVWNEIVD